MFDDGSGDLVVLGETSDVLDLTPVQETDFGTYRCSVNNSAGTGISGLVTVEEECKRTVVFDSLHGYWCAAEF